MKFFRKPRNIILCTLVMVGILILVIPAHAAGVMDTVASIVGNIVAGLVWIVGRVLVVLMYILIWVASYNDFINSQAVSSGWVILRDVCNMFFILILLVIAFTTVLNLEGYSWKKMLPQMLIMAVLINFSKLICGIFIDIAQVVMLTFVNGFRDIGGGNLTDMLGINKLLNIGGSEANINSEGVTPLSVMGTYVLALGYIIISTVVVVVILFVLIMRIVMLWILVTLSPLAYLLEALPNTKKYAEKWWKQFIDNVISGPILAFFIWLAFTSATADVVKFKENTPMPNTGTNEQQAIEQAQPAAGLSSSGSAEGMLKFIISIGMLIGGLMISKELSGTVGSIAGKGLSKIDGGAKALKNFGTKSAKTIGINSGRAVGQTGLRMVGAGSRALGNKINEKSGGVYGQSLQKSGQFLNSWGKDVQKSRKEAKYKKRKKTLEGLGMKADTMDALQEASKTTLGRSIKGGALAIGGGLLTGNPFVVAAGLAHMYGATNKDDIGQGLKNMAANKQKGMNSMEALKNYSGLEKGMSKEYLEKEKKKESFADSYYKDVAAVKQKHDDELNDVQTEAQQGNMSSEEVQDSMARINAAYQKEYASIANHYGKLANKVEENYVDTTNDETLRNDQVLHEKYQAAKTKYKKTRESAHAQSRRDEGIKNVDMAESIHLSSLEKDRDREIEDHKKNYSGLAQKVKIAETDKEYKDKVKKGRENYKAQRAQLESEYQATNKEALSNMTGLGVKGVNFAGEQVKKYETNRLTIEGAKLGSKEVTEAKDFVKNLLREKFTRFDEKDWSTGDGINDKQKKIYKNLAGSDKTSKEAVQRLVKDLQALRNAGPLNEPTKKKINSIKKGIAYSIHHEPDNKGGLKDLIDELNKIDTEHEKGWREVHDFGPDGHDGGGHHQEKAEEEHKADEHNAKADEHKDDSHGGGAPPHH